MSSQAIVDRITKLLRLARDQEGTPEGKTASSLAKLLMQRAGIVVELMDAEDEESKWSLLTTDVFPVPWKEYLGVTMAAAYRCECLPKGTPVAWQLWAFSEENDRLSSCRDHYGYVRNQVENRVAMMAARMRLYSLPDDSTETRSMIDSYASGLVFSFSKRLLACLGWEGTPPFAEDFDMEDFLDKAKDPLFNEDENEEEVDQGPGLVPYRHRSPADHVFDESHQETPPDDVLQFDPNMFAQGQQHAQYLSLVPSRLADAFLN
jgi:hypothetical protein